MYVIYYACVSSCVKCGASLEIFFRIIFWWENDIPFMSLGKHKVFGFRESHVGEGKSNIALTKYFCNPNLG